MNTTRNLRVLAIGLALACPSAANAQTPAASTMPLGGKAFVNLNIGAQTQSRTMDTEYSFPIYGQTATAATTVSVDGGSIFDLNFGYRITPRFGAAIGYSSFSSTGSALGAASIPSPVFFNRPAAVTIAEVDAKRTDTNIYLLLLAFVPITDKSELTIFVGPSGIKVKQDLFGDITAANVPSGTQNLTTVILSESKTALGVNIGADISYYFTKQVGVGVFARHNGGSVDLPHQAAVKAGGLQMGIGARVRF